MKVALGRMELILDGKTMDLGPVTLVQHPPPPPIDPSCMKLEVIHFECENLTPATTEAWMRMLDAGDMGRRRRKREINRARKVDQRAARKRTRA